MVFGNPTTLFRCLTVDPGVRHYTLLRRTVTGGFDGQVVFRDGDYVQSYALALSRQERF